MSTRIGIGFLAAATWLLGTGALAQEGVSQTVGHGKINWSDKTVTATGSAAPNLKASNAAAARLGAERAAKLDALRNILEALKGMRITGQQSAGEQMDATPELKARVEGIIKDFKVLDTKFYSDGGVDVIVQVPISGVLVEALLPKAGSATPAAPAGDASATGIIVNAKGTGVAPALAPRLVDDKGRELFSAAMVQREVVKQSGVAGYSSSVDVATKDARIGDKPLIVRAAKLSEPGGTDLVLNAEDAAKVMKLASLLASGKVIIVTD